MCRQTAALTASLDARLLTTFLQLPGIRFPRPIMPQRRSREGWHIQNGHYLDRNV
jgi:hypothetical protein